jgi:CheY-like chemotaxis protein
MPEHPPPRIFVVDDESVIAQTVALILSKSGFSAKAFTNPMEALAAATSNETPDVPDLIISDVVMPQLSGIELAIQIKQLCPNCKILLFSGQSGTADLLEGARRKGHDFRLLLKPIHPIELIQLVRDLGLKHLPETRSEQPRVRPTGAIEA